MAPAPAVDQQPPSMIGPAIVHRYRERKNDTFSTWSIRGDSRSIIVAKTRNGAEPGPMGSAEQPASTSPSTLSGYASAVSIAIYPPSERPTMTARPDAASASMAAATAEVAAGIENGLSARVPCPGRSMATQRYVSDSRRSWGSHCARVSRVAWMNTIVVAPRGPRAVQCRSIPGTPIPGPGAAVVAAGSEPRRRRPPPARGAGSVVAAMGSADLVLDRPEGRLGPAGEVELAEDVRHVCPRSPLRDV